MFVYGGDLWTSDMSGSGFARRLTSRAGIVAYPRFSPDGKWLAFTAAYDGAQNVYVMPAEGGEPRRVTFDPEPDEVAGWTPDGKIAYRSIHGSFTNRQARLWTIDPKVGGAQPTSIIEFGEGSFSPDGSRVAYNRQLSDRFNWRRYRGGSQGVISIYDLKNNTYHELNHERENSWRPMWVGKDIYYLSDKSLNTVNLYKFDSSNGQTKQLTNFNDHDMKWAQTDGQNIVFERNGGVYTYAIGSGAVTEVSPKVASDEVTARPYFRRMGNELTALAISPSGARVAAVARGMIFSIPAKAGETRVIYSHPGSRAKNVQYSPDGKQVAFLSDESGSYQIHTMSPNGGDVKKVSNHTGAAIDNFGWSPDGKSILISDIQNHLVLLDVASGAETEVMKTDYGFGPTDISPDSKWIAITAATDSSKSAIFLYDVANKKLTQVSEGYFSDGGASFDQNGKYLYFVSARTVHPTRGGDPQISIDSLGERIYMIPLAKDATNPLNPPADDEASAPAATPAAEPPKSKDMKVDLDGIQDRVAALPIPPGEYGQTLGGKDGVIYVSNGTITKFDLATKQSTPIIPLSPEISVNPTFTKIAYLAPGKQLCVTDVHPNITPGEGKVDTGGVSAMIDPRAEWKQMFWEAWRYEKDHFYDKNMLGMDWKAIGDNYASLLPQVRHRSDLNYLLGMLIGELGTSHAYVSGGEVAPVPNPVPIGQLGADFAWEGDHAKFAHILHGFGYEEATRGPLGELGVNVKDGEYLLAIDGNPVTRVTPPESLLLGKADRQVTLTVNSKPSMDGARKVVVKPIASEVKLRYADWIETNRKLVDKLSGGKIAYMHVPDTAEEGIVEFTKAYYSQPNKEALIVDERFNGGGYIPTFFIEKLQRQAIAGAVVRNSGPFITPQFQIPGPKVMLVNGYAGSGGDMFPWLFRENKLGPLMGTRTWGGLVGISGGVELIDGGNVTAPEFGLFDFRTGKWIAENNGVEPDIDVDARPDLMAKGQDPQLEQAVKYLLDQLQKQGTRKLILPKFPKVGK
ncbi:MAG: PD40 domain-containing protein [Armatimonadetes bacterium]|nr:PD40 domain-containing protein [Armatimonadota bacterium]